MSVAETDPALPVEGSATARRALIRWAVRLFRREWRQQLVVTLLLALAVAAATWIGTLGFNATPATANAEFGTANHYVEFQSVDREELAADVAAAREWFGLVEVIGRRLVSVPGRFAPLEYRTQDPNGPYGGPMLAVTSGRLPTGAPEVALTDGVAAEFDLELDRLLDLDGTTRTVVGIVENPNDLTDEFALLAPTEDTEIEVATVLLDASEDQVTRFRPPSEGGRLYASRGDVNEQVAVTVAILGVTTISLVLVALLASAGFMVMAQRRRRQLGMLAAIGATERHVRLALIANGSALGLAASLAGATVGIGAWVAAQPSLEAAIGFRMGRLDLPWWLIATIVVLGTAAATAAAWWPARLASRVSTIDALSGRPDRPRRVHRSAGLAVLLVAGGVGAMSLAGPVVDESGFESTFSLTNAGLLVGGTVAVVVGMLLAAPLVVRLLERPAAALPVAPRMALRDLARYQSRSGAALAALTMVLGLPAAIVLSASSAQTTAAAGNLAERQLLIRPAELDGPFVPTPAEFTMLQQTVGDIIESLDGATTTPLEVAFDPAVETDENFDGLNAPSLARRIEDGWADLSLLYVATPGLLSRLGYANSDPTEADILTTETGELAVIGGRPAGGDRGRELLPDQAPLTATYTSLPSTFISPTALAPRGLEVTGSGRWLIETDEPISRDQLSDARQLAAGGGLTIEARDQQVGLIRLRWVAVAAGILLALGVLAMTVGLIRGESATDLRTLAATGASSTTRRAIMATTAAALALVGSVLGAAGAVAVLAAGYLDVADAASRVPIGQAVLLVVGAPVIAGIGAWLLAGREPPAVTRQPLA